jgi:PAS domain-containing protein
MESPQKPLELILARNLLTSISTPSFLVDGDGTMVFYNEAAAAVLGRSFEEAGQMSVVEWTEAFGPRPDLAGRRPAGLRRGEPDEGDPRGPPGIRQVPHPHRRQPGAADRGGRVPDRGVPAGKLGRDDHVLAADG